MKYQPNKISFTTRAFNIIASLFLLIYGGYGVYVNDFALPTKKGRLIHLHDGPAAMHYAAFVCASLVMLSVVVDHYDNRNNEQRYQAFSMLFKYLGWLFFVLSLLWAIV